MESDIRLGLNAEKIGNIIAPLATFFEVFPNIYATRSGTIIIGAQPTRSSCDTENGGAATYEYGFATPIVSFNLPYEPAIQDYWHDPETKARRAVKDLLEGEELFRGQANRHLDSGIYYPAGRAWKKINRTAFSLTVVEASQGRFLVGYSDDHMQKDKCAEYEIAPLAIAWLLARAIPGDVSLRQSYDWIVRTCAVTLGDIANIEQTLEGICASRANEA